MKKKHEKRTGSRIYNQQVILYRVLVLMLLSLAFCLIDVQAVSTEQDKDGLGKYTVPVTTQVTEEGKAVLQVVISQTASQRVRKAAEFLAEYLGKISKANFEINTGDGNSGIAVGVVDSFPDRSFDKSFTNKDLTHREDYLIRSHEKGIYIIGLTDLAVEHGVWDFLWRLGYRQFFPGEKWEVIPREKNIKVAINVKESPDYFDRLIWPDYGMFPSTEKAYLDWVARNRLIYYPDSVVLIGHNYASIIRDKEAEFKAHPEYLALVDGQRNCWDPKQSEGGCTTKFCISNEGLRKLVVDWALEYFEKNPKAVFLSLDPSDGDQWCQCENCAKMGSVTDRVVTLVNEVAEAVNKRFGEKLIGIYAYFKHCPPPTIKVHPYIKVGVATAFIEEKYTLEELMQRWQNQGATVGMREYYALNPWDRDMPGDFKEGRPQTWRAKGGNITYLKESIPKYYRQGARFMSAESAINWGPNGLGYLVASRLLWDINEAKNVDAIVNDFLDKAFGSAKEPMDRFYQLIDGNNNPVVTDQFIAEMYRLLVEAVKTTDDPAVRSRIYDLVLWTHYAELFKKYAMSSGDARQPAFEEMIRYAYRIKDTYMVHTMGIYSDFNPLNQRDKDVSFPENCDVDTPEQKNPWKQNKPVTQEEIDHLLAKWY
ncbi:MAG: DUF4838 domain-containing protein [Planctomycetota bacterium]